MTREYTIHLHKHVHGKAFKKRAPCGVKAIIAFAQKTMGTTDVRIDPKLNQAVWERGVKSVPHRIRVKLERECLISYIPPLSRVEHWVGEVVGLVQGPLGDEWTSGMEGKWWCMRLWTRWVFVSRGLEVSE